MKTPSDLRPGERVFALLLLAISLIAFREAYMISGFSGLTTGGVLPMLAASVMIMNGFVILRDAFKRRTPESPVSFGVAAFLLPARLVMFTAFLALYAAAIPSVGFMAASGGFLFISIAVLWRRGLLWSAAITLIAILSIYVIFRLLFQVVLPTGFIWQ